MSDAVLIALLTTIPVTITSIAALVVGMRNSRKSDVRDEKIEEIHKTTNSMKDELVRVTRSDAEQQGHTKGVADEKARTPDSKQG